MVVCLATRLDVSLPDWLSVCRLAGCSVVWVWLVWLCCVPFAYCCLRSSKPRAGCVLLLLWWCGWGLPVVPAVGVAGLACCLPFAQCLPYTPEQQRGAPPIARRSAGVINTTTTGLDVALNPNEVYEVLAKARVIPPIVG